MTNTLNIAHDIRVEPRRHHLFKRMLYKMETDITNKRLEQDNRRWEKDCVLSNRQLSKLPFFNTVHQLQLVCRFSFENALLHPVKVDDRQQREVRDCFQVECFSIRIHTHFCRVQKRSKGTGEDSNNCGPRIKEKEEHKVVLGSPVFPDVFQPSSLLAGFPRNKKYLGPKSKGTRN